MQQIVDTVLTGLTSAWIVDATLTNKRLLGETFGAEVASPSRGFGAGLITPLERGKASSVA